MTYNGDGANLKLSAGPAGQPSYLTTAEILAPRSTFPGGVAVAP